MLAIVEPARLDHNRLDCLTGGKRAIFLDNAGILIVLKLNSCIANTAKDQLTGADANDQVVMVNSNVAPKIRVIDNPPH